MPEHDVRQSPSSVVAWVIVILTVFVLIWLLFGWMAADSSMTQALPQPLPAARPA